MKSYLIRQGIFYFVDGSLSCPPSHVVVAYGFSRLIFFFLRYKQQDELILSALLFSLSMNVLHLGVFKKTDQPIKPKKPRKN
jgi:hypothetical protein